MSISIAKVIMEETMKKVQKGGDALKAGGEIGNAAIMTISRKKAGHTVELVNVFVDDSILTISSITGMHAREMDQRERDVLMQDIWRRR